MPMIDMPIKELEQYTGTNPRPDDFNAYWDSATKEMNNVDPNVSITKAAFQVPGVECFDLYFTGVNDARIYSKYIRPAKIEKKLPAVIQFHGYRGNSGAWSSKLRYVSTGAAVFAMDVRGQAGKSQDVLQVRGNTLNGHLIRGLWEDDPHKLFYRDVFLDAAELARIVGSIDIVDETNIYVTGGSQGGGLALACAALNSSVSKIAAQYPFLCDYQRVWEMDLGGSAYAELKDFFRSRDPQHLMEKEIFTKLGYIDVQNLVNRIEGRTLMITGLMDHICPPSTQFAAYNKIKGEKRHLIYPDFGHEKICEANDAIFTFFFQQKEE